VKINYIILLVFTLLSFNNTDCQVIEKTDTNILYKNAYCAIVADSVFTSVRLKVSNKLITSSFMYFSRNIISQIEGKTKEEKAMLEFQLYDIDKNSSEDINSLHPRLSNQVIQNLIECDCNLKKCSDKVLSIYFSKIHSDLGYNVLFAEIWLCKGRTLGGAYYIYFFIFNNYNTLISVSRKYFIVD